MARSDGHAWFAAYDRKQKLRTEDGRTGLAWLGLVGVEADERRSEFEAFDRNVDLRGRVSSYGGGSSLSKPVDLATRLALLVWAGMIASLAVLFG